MEADEVAKRRRQSMIRIAITEAGFKAITATLPLGSVAYEAEPSERGERLIWLEAAMVDLLFPPSRRCYARHGVDRPASRHAGPRSLLPRPPQRGMEARPCPNQ